MNLQKLTLKPWSACASIKMFAPAQNIPSSALSIVTTLDPRMLEAQTGHGIGELDIHRQVV